jgi:hypothetical protein
MSVTYRALIARSSLSGDVRWQPTRNKSDRELQFVSLNIDTGSQGTFSRINNSYPRTKQTGIADEHRPALLFYQCADTTLSVSFSANDTSTKHHKELLMAHGRQNLKCRSRSNTGRKNPAAAQALRKKWQDPEYRATQTQINREVLPIGRRSRVGVPNGMTRAQAEPLWQQARVQADLALAAFVQQGLITFDPNIEEQELARLVLREALVIALSPLRDIQTKAAALRLVLEWTLPKPANRSKQKLQNAEAWLVEVLGNYQAASATTVSNLP